RQCLEICMEYNYQFNDYKSKPDTKPYNLTQVIFPVSHQENDLAEKAIFEGLAIAEAVYKTRNLGNTPPNICTPLYLAQAAQSLATQYPKIRVTVLDEKQISVLKMGALLAVGQGSQHPPKFITLEYQGHPQKDEKPIIL